ncbi:hypothetical protein F8388_008937 [Cannabis sativa]|uniref:Ubiquitin-like protease family profile domain-containing protein n=1 Tax=Cannabis sativa TaxID=3483 RepID=A0A7J6H8C2_CANSA|nr:hypothetical protein F8388_008937 [Cannabis sativa]
MSNKKSRDLPLSRTRSFGPKNTHNNDSTSRKSPPPVPCSPNEDSTTPSDNEIQQLLESKKNTRGLTRGDGVRRSLKNDTIRHHAPLQYSGWAKISPEDKKDVYARIMKKSAAGSKNRAKVSFMHSGGTKSFIQYLHEENEMVELRRDKLIQFEDGLLLVVDEAAIYRQVLGEGKYGWLRGLGPTLRKKISVELSSKHKEIEEERLDKLEKIIEDLRKDQDNNVARIVQENTKIFYESQQGRLLEERSSESPIRIPSMIPKDTPKGVKVALLAIRFIKASHTFSMVMDPENLDNDEYLHISPIDVIHLGTMKRVGVACIVFYISTLFSFISSNLSLDSCQAQNAMTMADRMDGTEAGQFWLLSVNTEDHWMLAIIDVLRETCYCLDSIGLPPPNKIKSLMAMTFDYYNASSNRQPKKSCITWKSIKCPQQISDFECGYYLMRYMREFCMNSRPINWLTTQWNGKKTYTKQEIDKICLEWANQFLEEITEDGVL